jgi:D-alanyl-lipoteichoic acid acyltransferase DltB (MBOAT superfamily)
MGFNLMKNFNTPYQAASITDFWRRWHISLSSWFRDYVYIPLGGNKGTKSTTIRNISIVFLLSGVWHGANWTFIVWGAIHACLLILEQLFISKKINTIQPTIWRKLLVFSLVTLAWIFFRSKDFNQAFQVLKNIFSFQFNLEINQISAFISPLNMLLCWICIPLLFLIDNIKFSTYRKHLLAFLVAGTLLIITLGKSNEAAFIYFQF